MYCSRCQSPQVIKANVIGTSYKLPCYQCRECFHQFIDADLIPTIYRRCPKAYIDRTELKVYMHIPKEVFAKDKPKAQN